MQHEATVNKMTLADAFAYQLRYEQQAKKEGKGDGIFGKDKKIATKIYRAEEDNCGDILHSVRFERGPTVEADQYWSRMPLRRKETYRHLALEQDGADNKVNENVITRAHDRTLPLRIRMFSKTNFAKKGFGEKAEKEPAEDWETPKGVLAIQEALLNFGDIYAKLWPLDNTPRRLERVLNYYGFGENTGSSERERCRFP